MCTPACNYNSDTCCNYFMNGRREIKEKGGRGELKYDTVNTL
jgi:hypothetical protein